MKAKAMSRQARTHTQEAASMEVRTFHRGRPARVRRAPRGEEAMMLCTVVMVTVMPMPLAKASSAK